MAFAHWPAPHGFSICTEVGEESFFRKFFLRSNPIFCTGNTLGATPGRPIAGAWGMVGEGAWPSGPDLPVSPHPPPSLSSCPIAGLHCALSCPLPLTCTLSTAASPLSPPVSGTLSLRNKVKSKKPALSLWPLTCSEKGAPPPFSYWLITLLSSPASSTFQPLPSSPTP